MATNSIKLLTGNSHPQLAKLVADRYAYPIVLGTYHDANMCANSLGIELTKIMVLQYSNQETSVTIGESVRDEDGIPHCYNTQECLSKQPRTNYDPRQFSSSKPLPLAT